MIKCFNYDNKTSTVELDVPELLLIKEFKALLDPKRNKCKEDKTGKKCLKAFREFTYIWLAIDWRSIYADYLPAEKHELSLLDSGLTEEEFNDSVFRAACKKYEDIQNQTRSIKLLQAAQNTVDKFIDYFNNVDPEERDEETNKPIYKVKDLMAEVTSLSKVHQELIDLETLVKKELSEVSTIRGGATDGYIPDFL